MAFPPHGWNLIAVLPISYVKCLPWRWRTGWRSRSRRHAPSTGSAGSRFGAHRTDLRMADRLTRRPANLSSTGQQKALLLGIVLSHARILAACRGQMPMLLLDEPLVHLDDVRRDALFQAIGRMDTGVLLTGTDREQFTPLRQIAEFVTPGEGNLAPMHDFGAECWLHRVVQAIMHSVILLLSAVEHLPACPINPVPIRNTMPRSQVA